VCSHEAEEEIVYLNGNLHEGAVEGGLRLKRNTAGDDIEIEIRSFRNFSYMLSESRRNRPSSNLESGLYTGGLLYRGRKDCWTLADSAMLHYRFSENHPHPSSDP
jgi:hypothetical protein